MAQEKRVVFKKSALVGVALLGVTACNQELKCRETSETYSTMIAERESLNSDQRYQQCIIDRNHRSGRFVADRFNSIEHKTPLEVIPTKESCLTEYNLDTQRVAERRDENFRRLGCIK